MATDKFNRNNLIIILALVFLAIIYTAILTSLGSVEKTTKEDYIVYSTSSSVYPTMSLIGIFTIGVSLLLLRKSRCYTNFYTAVSSKCFGLWLLLVLGVYMSFSILKDNHSIILNPYSIIIENADFNVDYDEIYSIEISHYYRIKPVPGEKIIVKFNLYSGKDKIIPAGTLLENALPDIKIFANNSGVKVDETKY